jgi:hypothetical protein
MTRYIPIVVGLALILGLTYTQIQMTDRLAGTNVTAAQRAELLSSVPMNVGDWHGEDKAVDASVQKTAGAIGAISRDYRNARTGDKVELWLIVGHARDIAFHTPDICYPASGFEARSKENSLYPMVLQGLPDAPFWTNTFYKEDELTGRRLIRVFWSWYNPTSSENEGKVIWEAPGNARWHFGNNRAIYKMYFTSEMRDPSETAEQSACLRFARDFMPEVDKALAKVYNKMNPEAVGDSADKPINTTPSGPEAQAPVDETIGDASQRAKANAAAGEEAAASGSAEVKEALQRSDDAVKDASKAAEGDATSLGTPGSATGTYEVYPDAKK